VAKYLDNGTSVSNGWAASGGGGKLTTIAGTTYSSDAGYSVQVSGDRVYALGATAFCYAYLNERFLRFT
jgi:hypothetical protein